VGFFLGATPDNAESAASVRGAVGLKIYMGSSTGSLLVDDVRDQLAHFQNWPADKLLAVHAEDEALVRRYMAEEELRRPAACAIAATRQALALAEITGRRLHICHVSTPEEMWMIEDARRRGVRVTCEATIHHLYFGVADEYTDDPRAKVNPPLRPTETVNALWRCFESLDAIASDHAPHTIAEKMGPNPPAGLPGLETMLPVMVNSAHGPDIDLPEVVKRTATRPAEIAGLHDRGAVEAGKLAHLTLIDMAGTTQIWNDELFTRCGWSPWNEQTLEGRIVSVYMRGREVFREDRFRVRRGKGEVL
jgi:dihydroorotase (multifunctional complex type)